MASRKAGKVLGKIHKRLFKFSAEQTVDSRRARKISAAIGAYSPYAQRCALGFRSQNGNQFHREPRGRVHRNIEGHQPSVANAPVHSELRATSQGTSLRAHASATMPQATPTQRVPPQFIRRDQNNLHDASL